MDAVVVNDSTTSVTAGTNIAGGDEEAQQIPSASTTSTSTLDTLQKQVREFQDKTDDSIELLQREIRDLQDRMIAYEGQSKSGGGGGLRTMKSDSAQSPPVIMCTSLMTGNMSEETTSQRKSGGKVEGGPEGEGGDNLLRKVCRLT